MPRNITRRAALQTIGAAGATAAFGRSVEAVAESADTKATDVTFAELGVSFDPTTNVVQGDHYDPLEFYRIADGRMVFSAIEQSDLEAFEANDAIVRYDTFQSVPLNLAQQEHSSMVSGLNARLSPTAGILLSEPVSTPPMQVETDSSDVVLTAAGTETRVSPGGSESVRLGSVRSTERTGDKVEATVEVIVKNHGELDVLVDRVLGGE